MLTQPPAQPVDLCPVRHTARAARAVRGGVRCRGPCSCAEGGRGAVRLRRATVEEKRPVFGRERRKQAQGESDRACLWMNERQINSGRVDGSCWGPRSGLESQFCAPAICANGGRTLGVRAPAGCALREDPPLLHKLSALPTYPPPTPERSVSLQIREPEAPWKSGCRPAGGLGRACTSRLTYTHTEAGDLGSPLLLKAGTGLPPSDLCISWITSL